MLLSGEASQQQNMNNTIASEVATLNKAGFATAAGLLELLSRAKCAGGPSRADAFLATSLYLRDSRHELAKRRATLGA